MLPSTKSARAVVSRSPARTVRVVNLKGVLSTPVECESSLERDFVHRVALCHAVKGVVHQPFRLPLPSGSYTPDFLATLRDQRSIVVEVKPESKQKKYREKFVEAKKVLAERGCDFVVLGLSQIREKRSEQRASLVLRYLKTSFDENESKAVVDALVQFPQGLPLGTLARRCGVPRDLILHLIAVRRLETSRLVPVQESALVFLPSLPSPEISDADRFMRWFNTSSWAENTHVGACD